MAKQPSQDFDWNDAANDQVAMLASANGAFVKALAKASQDYVEGIGKLTQEFSEFLTVRLQHDVELGETMSNCHDLTQMTEVQREWAQQAGEEYVAEAQKIAELGVKLATNGAGLFSESLAGTEAAATEK